MNDDRTVRGLRTPAGLAAGAAGLGWIAWLAGLAVAPEPALLAYLAAFVYSLTIALGALCLLMIAHASGARWFVTVRRVAEAIATTVPIFALLLLPILLGVERIYPWVPPMEELGHHARQVVEKKRAYLNVPFFVVRSLVYIGAWSWLALALWRWSVRRDEMRDRPGGGSAGERTAPERASRRAVALSAGGLMLFGFTLTFASFDWVMSLSPDWHSTLFGGYVFAGAMVAGLGAMLVVTRALERRGELAGAVAADHYHALGRLLLTFTALWAYMAFAQGMLIWIANLPHEVTWYLERWTGGWMWVLLAVVAGRFAVPFFLLLSRPLKRSGRALAALGIWALAAHAVDVFWLVLPALRGTGSESGTPGGPGPGDGTAAAGGLGGVEALGGIGPLWRLGWLEASALLAVAGTAVAFGAWRLAGRSAVPAGDPELSRSMEYRSP